MSNDLSKRLIKYCDNIGLQSHTINEVCGGIVQLERELAAMKMAAASDRDDIFRLQSERNAEKALADRLAVQLKIAEAALSDIGDAEHEDGDDLRWCEQRAAKAIPATRAELAAYRKARGL